MFAKKLVCLAAVCVIAVAVRAEEHPLAKAKVGDWAEYAMAVSARGHDMEQSIKKEVIKKTDTEVTLEVTMKMSPKGMPPEAAAAFANMPPMKQNIVINLNEKYVPGMDKADKDVEVKQVASGTESVTVAGKTYNTAWSTMEMTSKTKKEVNGKFKSWASTEVPLDGIVKAEFETAVGKGAFTLKDCGRGK